MVTTTTTTTTIPEAVKYPEHEKMKVAKAELGIEQIAATLEELAEYRIPYNILEGNKELWTRFVTEEDLPRFERFLSWVAENIDWHENRAWWMLAGHTFDHDAPLYATEMLFAAYAGIDLGKISAEKDLMVDEMRAVNAGDASCQ